MMSNKNKITLTYLEGSLLASQLVSLSLLRTQYVQLENQKETITSLTETVNKINKKIVEIQQEKVVNTITAKSVEMSKAAEPFLSSVHINPKLALCLILTGAGYVATPIILGKLSSIFCLPTFSSVLISPLKSAIALLPFIGNEKVLKVLLDEIFYRITMNNGQVADISVRPKDADTYTPVGEFIKTALQKEEQNNNSSSNSDISEIGSESASSIVEQVKEAAQTPEVVETVEAATALTNVLGDIL